MIRAALLTALLGLAGCASSEAVNDPIFRQGYDLGCSMAHSSREATRALTADKPELYRRGFAAGYSACGGGNNPGRATLPDSGGRGRP